MDENVEYDILEDALKRCHSNWHAAQSHGLLTASLAVAGCQRGLVSAMHGAAQTRLAETKQVEANE